MDINELERMGRRRFMETLAGIGVGTTTLQYMDQDELSDIIYDPEEEVPYVSMLEFDEDGGRTPVTDTIDAEKHERIEAALDARETLEEEYNLEGYETLMTSNDQSSIDFGLEVKVPETIEGTVEEIEDTLPTEISGSGPQGESYEDIPVDLNEMGAKVAQQQSSQQHCYSNYPSWQSGVPGGAAVNARGQGGEAGTITAPFNHDQHGQGWIMSGHVADNGGTRISIPNRGGPDYPLGRVRNIVLEGDMSISPLRQDQPIDFAFVEETSGREPSAFIASPDNLDYDLKIRALLTDENLKNHLGDESWEVQKRGLATCRQTSHITDYSPDGYAKIEQLGKVGDSGGPVFREYADGKAALGGVYLGSDTAILDRDGVFTTVEEIENRLDGNFYG